MDRKSTLPIKCRKMTYLKHYWQQIVDRIGDRLMLRNIIYKERRLRHTLFRIKDWGRIGEEEQSITERVYLR